MFELLLGAGLVVYALGFMTTMFLCVLGGGTRFMLLYALLWPFLFAYHFARDVVWRLRGSQPSH